MKYWSIVYQWLKALSSKFLRFQSQQAIEERSILFQSEAEIFCGSFFSSVPLSFQGAASICETLRNILDDILNQLVCLLHRSARVIYKFALDRQPAAAKSLGGILVKEGRQFILQSIGDCSSFSGL